MVKISISDNKVGALGGIQVDYKKDELLGLEGYAISTAIGSFRKIN
jgi:hypothetical protein